MIFNYVYTLPNGTTLDLIGTQTISAVGVFTPMLLAFVFFLVLLGGSARQKARTGDADFPAWSTIASMSTFMLALLMATITGIIQIAWLVIVAVVTIFCGIWLFIDRRQSEV